MNVEKCEARAVLVTGGSRGLGLEIVRALLACGYDVATCSRDESESLKQLRSDYEPHRLFWTSCDIGDERSEVDLVIQFHDWLGDRCWYGHVNNAGIAAQGLLATSPWLEASRVIEVNLAGALRLTRSALRAMLRSGTQGRIVSITSILGTRGFSGVAAYAASKAGVDGFTRALAREVGPKGITVNSIAAGFLVTGMTSGIDYRRRQGIVKRTPLRRLGQVADVVPLVSFLIGDGSSFITGHTFVVDGGLTC